jgi:hypothetical protein
MIKLGYNLMSEEHGPLDLVRKATRAERVGFDFAANRRRSVAATLLACDDFRVLPQPR